VEKSIEADDGKQKAEQITSNERNAIHIFSFRERVRPPRRGPERRKKELLKDGSKLRLDRIEVGLQEGVAIDLSEAQGGRTTGGEESKIGHAEKAQDGAKIGFDVVERFHDSAGAVDATGSENKRGFFAVEEADRFSVGISEGFAGAGNLIDPKLQGGWDAEVVHGNAKNVFIGGMKFGDELVGQAEKLLLFGSASQLVGVSCSDPRRSDRRDIACGEIAYDDARRRITLQPFLGEMFG
jgi:hypothetical protein